MRIYGGYSLKRSLKDYGWAVALAVMMLAFALSWQGLNPVNEAEDHVAAPVAKSLNIIAGQCPSNWQDVTARDTDAVVRSCERNGWIVILDAEGKFNYGWQDDTAGAEFKYKPEEIPGWPVSSR